MAEAAYSDSIDLVNMSVTGNKVLSPTRRRNSNKIYASANPPHM